MKAGLGWILGAELGEGSLSTAEAILLLLTPCLPFSIPAATTHFSSPRAERRRPAAANTSRQQSPEGGNINI